MLWSPNESLDAVVYIEPLISLTLITNYMKPILAILFTFLTLGAFAQGAGKPAASNNCFNEWYALFKDRGAKPIPTGIHDVVIAFRKGDYSECYMGKVNVMD